MGLETVCVKCLAESFAQRKFSIKGSHDGGGGGEEGREGRALENLGQAWITLGICSVYISTVGPGIQGKADREKGKGQRSEGAGDCYDVVKTSFPECEDRKFGHTVSEHTFHVLW